MGRERTGNHRGYVFLFQIEITKWAHIGDCRTALHRSLAHHLPVNTLMNNPAELHVRVRLST